jgi:hypothetical protein
MSAPPLLCRAAEHSDLWRHAEAAAADNARTMSAVKFLHYLLLPARPTVLLLIAVLTLGFLLALNGGLLGVPMGLLLLIWLFNYAYVLLEQIGNGAREPPVLAIEMVNPVNEPRPLLQLLIVLVAYAGLQLLATHVSPVLAVALGILVGIALPASIGALGVGDHVLQAVNPLALWHIMCSLRLAYIGIVALVLFYGLSLSLLADRALLPQWLLIPATQFAWLSVYALIGGSLYEQREALGHEPIDTPERRAARARRERELERARFMDTIYGEARGGNLAGAWRSIEHELARQHYAFECYDWMLEPLGRLEDRRLATRLAQDYLSRALARDNALVTRLVQRCIAQDASFRPRSGAETLRVAELLRLAGDRATAQALLLGFEQHFPGDGALAQALALAAWLRRD